MFTIPAELPDAEVIALLRVEVARHLVERRDWLLSKLYRLDIREADIQQVLAQADLDPAEGLAGLILARHREREAARATHIPLPEDPNEDYGDLSW